jgi:O-antigen ligase
MAKKRKAHRQNLESRRPPFDRILVYSLAFVVFALPLFIAPGITEYGYGKTIVALIAISVLSLLWGLSRWPTEAWAIRLPWITFPFLGFVLASILSLIHATNGRVVVQSLVLVVFFFQLLLIIANVIREKRDVTVLLFSLLASAFLVSLYGFLQYLGIVRGATGGTGLNEIITTLGNRNFLGGFLSYLLYPSVILLLRPRSKTLRVLSVLLISFTFGTTMLVEQTAAFAVLISASASLLVGWLIFRPIDPIRRNRSWLLALLLILLFAFFIEAPSGPLNSIVGLSSDGTSWIGRVWERNSGRTRELDWWVGWEMFRAHPGTGVGLGNYKLAFVPYKAELLATTRGSRYADLEIHRAAQAHSDYVQIGAELGILGILSLAALLITLPISMWIRIRRNPDEGDRFDLLLLSTGVVGFLVHALVSFPAHLPTSSLAMIVMTGLLYSPAYGSPGTTSIKLRRWRLKSAVIAVALIGLAVSIVAGRDLAANVLMGRGIEQLQLGQLPLAEQTFERSIALDFAPRQSYYYLATIQAKLGKYEEALVNFERCLTRFADENVYLVYADLASSLGKNEEATKAIELLLASNPVREIETRARYVQASIAIQTGDYDEATRLLETLAADAPDFEVTYIALGNLFLARGMPVDARAHLEQALAVIDQHLEQSERELSGRSTFTTEEYGSLTQRISLLQQERSFVLSKLAELQTP